MMSYCPTIYCSFLTPSFITLPSPPFSKFLLAPRLRIQPMPPTLEALSLNHRTAREVLPSSWCFSSLPACFSSEPLHLLFHLPGTPFLQLPEKLTIFGLYFKCHLLIETFLKYGFYFLNIFIFNSDSNFLILIYRVKRYVSIQLPRQFAEVSHGPGIYLKETELCIRDLCIGDTLNS